MSGLRPRLAALATDRRYALALFAALPAAALLTAATPLRLAPHWPAWRSAIAMLVAAPLLEELVFRWGLHDALTVRLPAWPVITPANLLTALVFALAHLWAHPPAWAAATLLPALVFGYFYERHASLAAPVGLHAIYNAAYLCLLT